MNSDKVNHPSHYTTGCPVIRFMCPYCKSIHEIPIECIDVIRDMPSWKGSAIKYLWREGLKNEEGMSDLEKTIEDLNKSIWYIDDKIKVLKRSCKNII